MTNLDIWWKSRKETKVIEQDGDYDDDCLDNPDCIPDNTPAIHDPFFGRARLRVKLPDGLECWHCILQWTYVTGNRYVQGFPLD